MKKLIGAMLISTAVVTSFATYANAAGKTIGVSWSNFQEERWKTDEAAMKAAIEANGDTYISAESLQSSNLADVLGQALKLADDLSQRMAPLRLGSDDKVEVVARTG